VKGEGAVLTKEEFKRFNLQIYQPLHGYRYSLDPFLLAHFCCQSPPTGSIIDLGAGCGIISLLLARLNPTASVVALENNQEMAALIEQNILGNNLTGQVTMQTCDVIEYRTVFPASSFDLVASNPPFRTPVSGRISPCVGRDTARHETTAGLADFLAAAKYLVKPSGRICIIHLPARLVELAALAAAMKLSVLRLRMVHNNQVSPATMFLAELGKGRRTAPVVEAPLFVRDMQGEYSDEVWW
jgi:tRNA1Val (adenine37-N6)-methyltransferase